MEPLSRSETITVAAAFNGPQDSGNGGYACGLIAQALGGRAEVSLRSPVPLDVPLSVEHDPGGLPGSLRVTDGDVLVAEARRSDGLDLAVPAAVDPDLARLAAAAYRGPQEGIFSHCFVCGRARADSLGVFAGQVPGRELVASPWTPPTWTAGPDGAVLPEFVWAVLDCPTYFAVYLNEEPALAFMVRDSVEIRAPVASGVEHVVIAWPLPGQGRKRLAGSALLSADGEVLATCEAMLVEPRGGG